MKTNDGIERLRADARSLFISTATIDDTLSWATPRQIDACVLAICVPHCEQCFSAG